MSWYQFITARSRVYLDEDGADGVVEGIKDAVDRLPEHWEVSERDFEWASEYVDISIKAQGETHGAPESIIGEALDAVSALGGRSGAAIIYESDFGVDGCDLYGVATNKEVSLSETRGFEWCFEDTLTLRVTMPAVAWHSVLADGEGALPELIEDADVDLLRESIVPHYFEAVDEKPDEIAFQIFDVEPYMSDGDYGDDELVTAIYEFDGHELSGEAFELMLVGFDRDAENLKRLGAEVLLSFENAGCEEGVRNNVVVDVDNMAFLKFSSAANEVMDVRASEIDGVGLVRE